MLALSYPLSSYPIPYPPILSPILSHILSSYPLSYPIDISDLLDPIPYPISLFSNKSDSEQNFGAPEMAGGVLKIFTQIFLF